MATDSEEIIDVDEVNDTAFDEAEAMLAALEEQDIAKAGGITKWEAPIGGEIYVFNPSHPGVKAQADMGSIHGPSKASAITNTRELAAYNGLVIGTITNSDDSLIAWDVVTVPSGSRSKVTRANMVTSRECVQSEFVKEEASKQLAAFKRWDSQVDVYQKLKKEEAEAKKKAAEEAKKSGLAETREKWTEILDLLYPGDWSIESRGYDNYNLVIHFPKVTIRNTTGERHDIHDLYVIWGLDDKMAPAVSLTGWRGSLTRAEYERGYKHSHLPARDSSNSPMQFCLGSGEFSQTVNGLNSARALDWDLIQKALVMLHLYVEWESTEGTPHTYMRNIPKGSSRSRNRRRSLTAEQLSQLKSAFMTQLQTDKPKGVAKVRNNNGVQLMRVNEDKLLPAMLNAVKRHWGDLYCDYILPDGTRIEHDAYSKNEEGLTDSQIRNYNTIIGRQGSIVFKGKTIVGKLYVANSEGEDDTPEPTLVPSKAISDYLLTHLENDLNIYAINNSQ